MTTAATSGVPVEQAAAMGHILDAWRLSQGWTVNDQKTQFKMIEVWCALLDAESVPFEAYAEIFKRAIAWRTEALRAGREMPMFSVEYMLAIWNDLRKEMQQKRVDSHRLLPDTAASQCDLCFGTRMQIIAGQGARRCPKCLG